jgi:anaerobic selenocysteine-containing dehydrogenase
VWPYYYAGTMGLVMRDGINRLRHVKRYSGQYSTICTNMAWTGYIAGTGKLAGPDPREMALSDCVVIWGTNPVHTQVNVMTHAMKARKERGAKIVAVDVYMNATMKQADMALLVRPARTARSPARSCMCSSATAMRIGITSTATPIAHRTWPST